MPVGSPLSTPLDLVLHIGSGKTGTSSIQYFMHQNRSRLAELGHLYPRSPGRRRHTRFGLYLQPEDALADLPSWGRRHFTSPKAFRRTFRSRLFREINRSGLSRVLISDEALYGSPDETLQRLREFTDANARSVRLVTYLRRQDDHLVSRYQQVVKVGETRRLDDRTHEVELTKTYDYYARLQTWQQLLQPTEMVVRRFERESFTDGSLYQDFLGATGIDARADELEQVEVVNESLDAESVEFLRIFNLLHRQRDEVPALRTVGGAVRRLERASEGPTLTLPDTDLDAFMEQWREPNAAVARDFVPGAPPELFRTPRRTRNTTTEQYLDPARVDHLFAVSGLPEELRAPLRRVAESEAGRRAPSEKG
jgi:hypothetical protein